MHNRAEGLHHETKITADQFFSLTLTLIVQRDNNTGTYLNKSFTEVKPHNDRTKYAE